MGVLLETFNSTFLDTSKSLFGYARDKRLLQMVQRTSKIL